MADYQSVLTRAVAKLPGASSADMRRAIYDRAREAMLTHLRGLHPRMPESDITREEIALNQAIALVEAKFDATEADPAKPTAAKPAPPAAGYPDRIEAGASPRPAQLGQPTNLKSVPSSLAESAPAAPLLRGPATAPPSPVLQHLPPARPPSASSNLAKVVPPADAHASRSLAVALSIVLSLAGAAIVMRQNPQDRVIAPLQHGREISPEPSAKITQHAQLSPTVASESQGSQSVAQSGRETSQPAPEPDRSIAPWRMSRKEANRSPEAGRRRNRAEGGRFDCTVAMKSQEANRSPKADGKRRNPRRSRTGRLHPWRMSRKEANRSPEAGRRRNPRRRRTVRLHPWRVSPKEANRSPKAGETSQPAPQADGSTALVASESQGSQSVAQSGGRRRNPRRRRTGRLHPWRMSPRKPIDRPKRGDVATRAAGGRFDCARGE